MPAPYTMVGDLNIVTLLYFLFFVLTIVLGTFVYIKNQGSITARLFLILSIVFAVLHLGEALFSWTTVKADAYAFYAFKAIGFVFWWPLALHLFLRMREEAMPAGYKVLLATLYAYSAVLVGATLLGICRPGDDLTKYGMSWIDTPFWHPLAVPFLIMMPLCLALDMWQLYTIRRRAVEAGNARTIRQMDLIALSGLLAGITGIFINNLAPLLNLRFPPVGHLFLGLWIMVLGYAIVRYRLFVPTLEYARRQIFQLAGEMIVLTDLAYNIVDVNDSFVKRVGDGGANRKLSDLLLENGEPISDLDHAVRDRIVTLLTRVGPPVYVKINGSLLTDQADRIGFVFVLSDISELKEQNAVLEARVLERTKELLVAKIEAERRLRVTEIYTRRSIVDVISQGLDPTQFKPQAKNMAVLFTDIRDFTKISEDFSPMETVELLNQYFDAMNTIILKSAGEIDKLIGDCIMALYKTPDDAVGSAIAIRKVLREFNSGRQLKLRINNGIGINYGEVVSGNIGSTDKMDYTVIGDTVNTSNRLEALTKYYRLPILISEDVKRQLQGEYFIRYIDTVFVKGKKKPLALYEVFDHEIDEIKAIKQDNAPLYHDLYELYRCGRFGEALAGYTDLRGRLGEHNYIVDVCKDPVIDLYMDRCRFLLNQQNAGTLPYWTGVYEFHEK